MAPNLPAPVTIELLIGAATQLTQLYPRAHTHFRTLFGIYCFSPFKLVYSTFTSYLHPFCTLCALSLTALATPSLPLLDAIAGGYPNKVESVAADEASIADFLHDADTARVADRAKVLFFPKLPDDGKQ
jgi:hypothetical protein